MLGPVELTSAMSFRFRFVLAPDETYAVKELQKWDEQTQDAEEQRLENRELSIESVSLARDIRTRLEGPHGGTALIIDYGEDGGIQDSFRVCERIREPSSTHTHCNHTLTCNCLTHSCFRPSGTTSRSTCLRTLGTATLLLM